MSISKITAQLDKIQAELNKGAKITALLDKLLQEPSLTTLPNYQDLVNAYGPGCATRAYISSSEPPKKPTVPVKSTYVDSIYAPKWAQGSDKNFRKHIQDQAKQTGMKHKTKINLKTKTFKDRSRARDETSSNIDWINPCKDETVDKIEYDGKTYLTYNGDLFTNDNAHNHVGSISGGQIVISCKTIELTNKSIVNLKPIPETDYYQCRENYAYELIGGLAKRIGEVKDNDVYAYA